MTTKLGGTWLAQLIETELLHILRTRLQLATDLVPVHQGGWHLLSILDRCELLVGEEYQEYASRLRDADLLLPGEQILGEDHGSSSGNSNTASGGH